MSPDVTVTPVSDAAPELTDRTGILVAYDDTPAGRRAAAFAIRRAERTGETVTVVHVGEDLDAATIRAGIEATIDASGGIEAVDAVVEVAVVAGGGSDDTNVSVPTALAQIIRNNDFELLVMGNEPHGLFHGLTEASVSKALLTDHDLPITLVP